MNPDSLGKHRILSCCVRKEFGPIAGISPSESCPPSPRSVRPVFLRCLGVQAEDRLRSVRVDSPVGKLPWKATVGSAEEKQMRSASVTALDSRVDSGKIPGDAPVRCRAESGFGPEFTQATSGTEFEAEEVGGNRPARGA